MIGESDSIPEKAPKLLGPRFAESDWHRRTFGKVEFQAPFNLIAAPSILDQLSPDQRKSIVEWDVFSSLDAPKRFQVTHSQVTFTPETQRNLDDAVHDSIFSGATVLGDKSPSYQSHPVLVSGLEGRRAEYQGTLKGQLYRIDLVLVGQGQNMWQVQVVYVDNESAEAADRILDSVQISP